MTLQQRVEALEPYLIELRRHFHQYPEPSLKEYETSKFIQEVLDKHDIPYETVDETGVLAIVKGEKGNGKTILLRADIDALEIEEKTGAVYASKREGLSHACGHDAHTTMGLGTAIVLNELKQTFSGTVKIAFQPAEEIGAGAKQFIKHGKVADVEEAFAIHVNSGLPVGQLNVRGGAVNASCDIFKIRITGRSSHVGLPQLGRDALVTGSEVVVALQTIVAREVAPTDNAVVGIGKFHSGSRYNIVANEAILEGTIRAFSHETRAHLQEAVTRIVKGIATTHRCDVEIDWYDAAAPVINDEQMAQCAVEVGQRVEGIERVVVDYGKSMGADDFADYLVHVPGVYALLGSQSDERTAYGHHHEKFDIDERVLRLGVLYEVSYLLDRLS
ncbi:amidohydrolase [Carnobacteriaceae bacterium zg-ZUI78]|nr:amidohydrolase [Carnobacteriaceae bacterium zg-ZUI78]